MALGYRTCWDVVETKKGQKGEECGDADKKAVPRQSGGLKHTEGQGMQGV